jgi:hypothetical protein
MKKKTKLDINKLMEGHPLMRMYVLTALERYTQEIIQDKDFVNDYMERHCIIDPKAWLSTAQEVNEYIDSYYEAVSK